MIRHRAVLYTVSRSLQHVQPAQSDDEEDDEGRARLTDLLAFISTAPRANTPARVLWLRLDEASCSCAAQSTSTVCSTRSSPSRRQRRTKVDLLGFRMRRVLRGTSVSSLASRKSISLDVKAHGCTSASCGRGRRCLQPISRDERVRLRSSNITKGPQTDCRRPQ